MSFSFLRFVSLSLLLSFSLLGGQVSSTPIKTNVTNIEGLDDQARAILARATQAAPHFVVYGNKFVAGTQGPPPAADIQGFNVFALSFLLLQGPWDKAQEWASLPADQKSSIKAQYDAAGIKLIVAAFGATDQPTTSGADPVATANRFADFVKANQLDGIDIDYEDFPAFNSGDTKASDWLIAFTRQLRSQLPQDQFIITHAPVAPWFSPIYPQGGYLNVHRNVGDMIDWYNLQFYNQGVSEYTTCDGLLTASSTIFPQSALFQIAANGVPLDKLVIGKPASTGDANNGFMDPAALAQCLQVAKGKGWNGGAMSWQFPTASASWIKTVRSLSWPL